MARIGDKKKKKKRISVYCENVVTNLEVFIHRTISRLGLVLVHNIGKGERGLNAVDQKSVAESTHEGSDVGK